MTGPVIQLTRSGAALDASGDQIEQIRNEFREHHFIRLRQLLEPSLLREFMARIDRAHFEDLVHEGIGKELWLEDPGVAAGIDFLLNDPQMFDFVERIAECGHIGSFGGRVYRLLPGGEYSDDWHSDLGENRRVALSLNLSPEPYRGGLLRIRSRDDHAPIAEVANRELGDAVLFRLREDLQHKVMPLEGNVARTAYAGWFKSEPEFNGLLAGLRSQAERV